MKIIAITQARVGSSRLPGKVLRQIGDKTLLDIHLERMKKSRSISELIVATTTEDNADAICSIAAKNGVQFFQGSVDDVLERYYFACRDKNPEYIVRITSDCPLIDPALVDDVIEYFLKRRLDYLSNSLEHSFPDGQDIEVFRFSCLREAFERATLRSDREHVTPYIWRNSSFKGGSLFTSENFKSATSYADVRMTVDEPRDLDMITKLVEHLGTERKWLEYAEFLKNNPAIFEMNSSIKRNEGYMKSIEQEKVYLRNIVNFSNSEKYRSGIHDLIPGGAHTYSKGDDQFPAMAPAAISHGKGGHVWDIDGNEFLDCSMGLGSVSLGHAYEPVLDRVMKELQKGVNFQRPSVLEYETATRFLELVPGHDMIKFAKSGSIVTTAAVKLARAYTGRKLVAFPQEHPFYSYDDWFIGKTACSLGVPDETAALSVTYKADDLDSLKDLFEKYPGQIACVISEPEKNFGIPENYLQDAIAETHKNGALYILDEMVTGFKTAFPGSLKKYNVVPDLATWGKGIANGFSFCALTGKKEIMELGGIRNKGREKVFLISTTHGGETHALAANNATIEIFQNENVIEHNHSLGSLLIKLHRDILSSEGLGDYIQVSDSNWMPVFVFRNADKAVDNGFRTLMLQEMIKRGVLFQGVFIPCYSHTTEDIYYFAAAFEDALGVYKKALSDGFDRYLVGEQTKPVFRKFL